MYTLTPRRVIVCHWAHSSPGLYRRPSKQLQPLSGGIGPSSRIPQRRAGKTMPRRRALLLSCSEDDRRGQGTRGRVPGGCEAEYKSTLLLAPYTGTRHSVIPFFLKMKSSYDIEMKWWLELLICIM